MKDIMLMFTIILGLLSTVFAVIGGAVLLKTWHYVFVVLLAVKILIILGVFVAVLSWWTVFLVPIGMVICGFVFIGLGILAGSIVSVIVE